MKHINRILVIVVLFFNIAVSCKSQNKEAMDQTVNALLGNLYKDVHYLDSAINYHLQVTGGACAFQVLVNDLRVFSWPGYDASGSISINMPLNKNILHSGKQTWEVRVFPSNDERINQTALSEGVSVQIGLSALRYHSQGVTHLIEPFTLFSTPLEEKNGGTIYADAGKPMMVYKGTFDAKVPYNLVGWSKSKDLTKMDKDKLQTMLVSEYNLLANYIKNGDLDKLAIKLLKREQDVAQCLFYTENENKVLLEDFHEIYAPNDFKIYPIENYIMTFWGNGRMVSLERTDYIFNPALITEFYIENSKGEKRVQNFSYRLFFHIPEGSDQLEIIR